MNPDHLARVLLDRAEPLVFQRDVAAAEEELTDSIGGKSFLVVGAAGTIGAATTLQLLRRGPARVDLVDLSENGLAELARDVRSRGLAGKTSLRFLPLDLASPLTARMLAETPAYDGGVLSFAALKHVRSEKDPYTLLRLLKTNVLDLHELMGRLEAQGAPPRLFAVSTDKAADPTSLMGASKRLMEGVLFGAPGERCAGAARTSTRFANVAFSAGSLLESWQLRLDKRQPLACPVDTSRFFVTPEESGLLCLLTALALPAGTLAVPRGDRVERLWSLVDLARRFLAHHGMSAHEVETEDEARELMASYEPGAPYPLLLTPRNTAGEKESEVFAGEGETLFDLGLEEVAGVRTTPPDAPALKDLLAWLSAAVEAEGGDQVPTRASFVDRLRTVLPQMEHRDSAFNLDQRM